MHFVRLMTLAILTCNVFLLSSCGYVRYQESKDANSDSTTTTTPDTAAPIIKPVLKIQKESIPNNLTLTEGTTLVVYVALSSSSTLASQFTIQLEGSAGEVVA
jgi:hypothetical protein